MIRRLLWLKPGAAFPSPEQAMEDPNGLLAAGADLRIETLLCAYSAGIFPWFSSDEPILWWSPDPRGLLWNHCLHISHSLLRLLKKNSYCVRTDSCFSQVITACAATRTRSPGTWIVPAIQEAYLKLHLAGYAHSVEVYNSREQLVGGVYGVQIGSMFFGESMFSREPNTSKLALVLLSTWLSQYGCPVIDTQLTNPHLLTLGAVNCPRQEFLGILRPLLDRPASVPWGTILHWPLCT